MKGIIVLIVQNLTTKTWRIPFVGQGYFHNLSLVAYVKNEVVKRMYFHFGKDASTRMTLSAVETFQVMEVNNDRNWNVVLNYPVSQLGQTTHSTVFAHRARPLYVHHGDPLHLSLVGEDTPDINFLMVRYEFIPFWNSKCAYGIWYKTIALPEDEDFIKKFVIPFSIREGLVTYKITSTGSAGQDDGFLLPIFQKAGSEDEGRASISEGRGVISDNMDITHDVIGMGSVLQEVIPINSPGVGGTNQKSKSVRTPTTHEGATISFDVIDIDDGITALHIFIRIDFKILLNRRGFMASFLDGNRVVLLNDARVASF